MESIFDIGGDRDGAFRFYWRFCSAIYRFSVDFRFGRSVFAGRVRVLVYPFATEEKIEFLMFRCRLLGPC